MEQVFFRLHLRIYNLSKRNLSHNSRRLVELSAFIVAATCLFSLIVLHANYVSTAHLSDHNYLLHALDQPAIWNNSIPPPVTTTGMFLDDSPQYRILHWTKYVRSRYDLVLLKVKNSSPDQRPIKFSSQESEQLNSVNQACENNNTCKNTKTNVFSQQNGLYQDEYTSVQEFEISPKELFGYLYPSKVANPSPDVANDTLKNTNSYLFTYQKHLIVYLQENMLITKKKKLSSFANEGEDLLLPRLNIPLRILEMSYYPQVQLSLKYPEHHSAHTAENAWEAWIARTSPFLLSQWLGNYDIPMTHWIEQSLAFYYAGFFFNIQRKEMLPISATITGTNRRSIMQGKYHPCTMPTMSNTPQTTPETPQTTPQTPSQTPIRCLDKVEILEEFLRPWNSFLPTFLHTFLHHILQRGMESSSLLLPADGWTDEEREGRTWGAYAFFRSGIIFSTSFLLFIGSTLISYILRETQDRMLRFTYLLQYHITHQLPYLPLIFLHVTENLVFVPIIMGIYFFLFEFYSDQLLAFLVLFSVWVGEVFSVLCLRSKISIYYFPKVFSLFFFLFHIYFFTFPNGFSYLFLLTTVAFDFQCMCHLWNEYELHVLESGQVSATRPRLHITTTMQNVGAAMHSMMLHSTSGGGSGTGGGGSGIGSGSGGGVVIGAGGAQYAPRGGSVGGIPPPPIAPGQRLLLQQQQQRRGVPLPSALRGSRNVVTGITTGTTTGNGNTGNGTSGNGNTGNGIGTSGNGITGTGISGTGMGGSSTPLAVGMSRGTSGGSGSTPPNSTILPGPVVGRPRSNSTNGPGNIYESLEARRLRLANAASGSGSVKGSGGELVSGIRSRSNSYDSAGGIGGALGAIYNESEIFTTSTAPSMTHFPPFLNPPNSTKSSLNSSLNSGLNMSSKVPPRLTSDSLPKMEVDRMDWLMNHHSISGNSGNSGNSHTLKIPSAPIMDSPTMSSNPRTGMVRSNTEDEYAEVIGNFIDEDDFSAPSTTPRTAFKQRKLTSTNTNTNTGAESPALQRMNTTSTTASSTKDYGYSNANFNIFGGGSSSFPSEDNLGKY